MSETDEFGKNHDDLEAYIQRDLLGHCLCGSPRDSLEFLRKVLSLLNEEVDESSIYDY